MMPLQLPFVNMILFRAHVEKLKQFNRIERRSSRRRDFLDGLGRAVDPHDT